MTLTPLELTPPDKPVPAPVNEPARYLTVRADVRHQALSWPAAARPLRFEYRDKLDLQPRSREFIAELKGVALRPFLRRLFGRQRNPAQLSLALRAAALFRLAPTDQKRKG